VPAPIPQATVRESPANSFPEVPAVEPKPSPADDPVPDLRTRKTGSDWEHFLGPERNSVSTEKGIITPWPKEGLRVVWTATIGAGYVMPAISKGRLFLFDADENKQRLRCLKSETGEFLWKFEYPSDYEDLLGYDSGPRSTPIVDGSRVYIHGPEGLLHCLRVTDGKVLWKVDTQKRYGFVQNFFGVGSAPVVEGDFLLVHVGGSPPNSPPTYSGKVTANGTAVVAFNKYSGEQKWAAGDDLASYAAPLLATIDGRRWLFLFARGGLLGMEPSTGRVHFHYPWRSRLLESVNASNPVVVGDRVFLSECYSTGSSLLRIKGLSYEVLWKDNPEDREKKMRCHWNTPIHHNGYLYGCSGRNPPDSDLRCIELATGKVMWIDPCKTRSSLLMVDGHFICLDERGPLQLIKVNPEKFDLVSEVTLHSGDDTRPSLLRFPCWAAPILSHGLLYVRGRDRLVCLELIPDRK
jgi:outer membrane protein assembly factor BamB